MPAVDGKPGKPPDFAMLIGKRLASKGGDGPPPDDGQDGADGGDDKQHQMQVSAMNDLIDAIHAKDPEAALAAHTDLLQMNEPDGDEGAPSADDEEAPPPAA